LAKPNFQYEKRQKELEKKKKKEEKLKRKQEKTAEPGDENQSENIEGDESTDAQEPAEKLPE